MTWEEREALRLRMDTVEREYLALWADKSTALCKRRKRLNKLAEELNELNEKLTLKPWRG